MTPSLRSAISTGLNMEREWNQRMFIVGYHGAYQKVPPLNYRLVRAAHMAQMAVRERVALTIAPWLEPPECL